MIAVVFESGQQAPDTWMSHGCFLVELCDGDDAIVGRGAEPRMRSVRGDPQYPWTISRYFLLLNRAIQGRWKVAKDQLVEARSQDKFQGRGWLVALI